MDILKPISIKNSHLTSTNVSLSGESEYDHATTYALNDLVKVTAVDTPTPTIETNKVYKSAQASNQGNDPATDDGTWWIEQYSVPEFKMFDNIESDQSERSGNIAVTLDFSQVVTGIAFFNLQGYEIEVVATSQAEGEVYNQTHSLVDNGLIVDEWSWCFYDITRRNDFSILSIPPYDDLTIDITITDDDAAKCGICAVGNSVNIGKAQWGADYGILDYSLKSIDADTGQVSLEPGSFSETARINVVCRTNSLGGARRFLTGIRATAVAFIAKESLDGSSLWGITREWNTYYGDPTFSMIQLEVEGLISS